MSEESHSRDPDKVAFLHVPTAPLVCGAFQTLQKVVDRSDCTSLTALRYSAFHIQKHTYIRCMCDALPTNDAPSVHFYLSHAQTQSCIRSETNNQPD